MNIFEVLLQQKLLQFGKLVWLTNSVQEV